MRYRIILLATLIATLPVKAQDFYKKGEIFIKGNVRNFKEAVFDFYLSSYINGSVQSVVVKKDGSFAQTIPVQGRQSIGFYLNDDVVSVHVQDGDTLRLSWDAARFEETFVMVGGNEMRTKELQVEYRLRKVFEPALDSLDSLVNARPIEKQAAVNKLFNRHVQALVDSFPQLSMNADFLITHLYFQYRSVLENLLNRPVPPIPGNDLDFDLSLVNRQAPAYRFISLANRGMYGGTAAYKKLSEIWFYNIPSYRDFLYNYMRFYGVNKEPFTSYEVYGAANPAESFQIEPSIIMSYYEKAIKYITIKSIREWFLTKCLFDGVKWYSFKEVDPVFELTVANLTTPWLKDTLEQFYAAAQRLAPGTPAPAFTLKDENGKAVSLSDFKGKVVYLDFWGTYCGPCIYEFKNHVAQLHERYKEKDIVFINICVDAQGKELKAALKKYNIAGINLFGGGSTETEVCKAYNVSAVPQYVIIDKDGRIVNHAAPRPSELNANTRSNEIDALLQ